METVNLFGAQRGRAAQAAAWAMEKERFSTQEMANALAVSTPTAITLLRRLEGHGLVQPCGEFSSTGGRKPRAWSACPGARYVVGADITLRHVSLVAVDLSGQVTRTQTRTLAFTRTPAYFGRSPRSSASCARSCPGNRFWASACPFPASSAAGRTSSCAPTRFPFRDCGPMNSNNISACPAA